MIYLNSAWKYLATFAAGAILMLLLIHPGCNKCPDQQVITVTHRDTIRYAVKVESKPELTKVIRKPVKSHAIALQYDQKSNGTALPDTAPIDNLESVPGFVDLSSRIMADPSSNYFQKGNSSLISEPSPCDSIYYYTDTAGDASHYVIITDTLADNSFIGRSVMFGGFNTSETKTIPAKDKWRVYIGASFTINQRNMDRWGAGVSALLTIPKIGAVGYYYDARNNAHTGSIMALLRFRK